ncbi:MAG: apolipoprotein N-acyltransferase [Ilumatobacteraceae bacterium]
MFGGFLVALSMPPWGFWPLALIGIALLEVSQGARPSARRRTLHGFMFGLAWMSMGMGWMWFLTIPGYAVASLVFAGLHALAALLAPTGPWRVIGRPVAHTLAEAVRLAWPFGGVPLATIGIGQASGPFLDVAGVAGVLGLTWLTFQIAMSVAGPAPVVPRWVGPATGRRRGVGAVGAPHGTIALGAVVVLVVLSVVAPSGSSTGGTLTIAAVQGGGEQGTTAIDVPAALVTQRHLDATAGIDPADPAFDGLDLVLWPENVIAMRREPFEGSSVNGAIAAEAARLGVPFSTGITEDADVTGRGGPDRFTNAQVVVLPDGSVTSRYDKVRRVPFGEYVPLRGLLEALGAPIDQIRRDAISGTVPAVLDLPSSDPDAPGTPTPETLAAVAISWEVFFADRVREGVRAGGEVVLNPTNGASYTGTVLQTQQIASSRLRAVETGRWVVQAAPTGFTAFVSPTGEVVQRTGLREQAVLVDTVDLRGGTTWYTRLGDLPIVLVLVALLGTSMWFGGSAAQVRERITARRSA